MRCINPVALLALLLLSGCTTIPARDDPWSSPDKLRHFGASAVIAAAAAQNARNHEREGCEAFRIGFVISSGVGIAKEAADDTLRHVGWSWRDLAMDVLGALAGSLIVAPCR